MILATKETAVAGAVVAGGGEGGGYAAYKYINSQQEEETQKKPELQNSPSESQTVTVESKLLSAVGSGDTGKPITKVGIDGNSEWWTKAFNRYFLEVQDSNGDKIDELGGGSIRKNVYTDKSSTLKIQCQTLLSASYTSDDAGYKKAKKWCVTYKTVKETLGTDKSKGLEEISSASWDGKFDGAVKETTLKEIVEKLKELFSSDSDEATKKKKAVYKWCSMALDASEDYTLKSQVNTVCAFKTD